MPVPQFNPVDATTALSIAAQAQGVSDTNKKNLKIAREQMAFQEMMSNTAYQRAMKDMGKAGLNPMLAFSQGGASTPPGSSTRLENPLEGLAANVIAMRQTQANTALTQAQTATEKERKESLYWDNMDRASEHTATPNQRSIREEEQEGKRSTAQLAQTNARIRAIEEKIASETATSAIDRARSEKEIAQHKVSFEEAQATLANLNIAEAKAMSDWYNRIGEGGPAAKAMMTIGEWLNLILRGKK